MIHQIILSAFIGSDNLGDRAIFEAASQSLLKLKHSKISAFTINKKNHDIEQNDVNLIHTTNIFVIIYQIIQCDLLIIGGGGLIQDYTTAYNLLRHTYKAFIALILRKKYMFYSVGVDKLNFKINRIITKVLFNHASKITVRDQQSKIRLKNLGVTNKITVSVDPAINLAISPVRKRVIPRIQGPYIAVCLRHWFNVNPWIPVTIINKFHLYSPENRKLQQHFITVLASFLDTLVGKFNVNIVFVPFFYGRDENIHKKVLQTMNRSNRCLNINQKLNTQQTLSVIQQAEFVIGMRLHSLIFASIVNTPFIGLIYSEKVSNYLNKLKLSNLGISVGNIELNKLEKLFSKAYEDRQKIKIKLEKQVEKLKQQEKLNIKTVEKILFAQKY